jgi:hypothetical protein
VDVLGRSWYYVIAVVSSAVVKTAIREVDEEKYYIRLAE